MTRFEPETPAPRPAVEEGDVDHIPQPREGRLEDSHDSLFDRWLARSTASQPRLRGCGSHPTASRRSASHSGVPTQGALASESPLGDDLADAWFK